MRYLIQVFFLITLVIALVSPETRAQTIARDWDEQCLSAVRTDTPHPPAQARNLFSLSVCMYDAWAAATNGPVGYVYRRKHTASPLPPPRPQTPTFPPYPIL